MNPVFRIFSSLLMTVILLALSIVLVFFGTLDQVQWGISHTQKLYFESWIVMTPAFSLIKVLTAQQFDPELAWFVIPIPGGFTLGALLLVNLICAHFRYFKASWKKCGIAVLHLGVLLLLVSGFLTSMLQEESQMRLDEGGAPVNFSTDFNDQEIVLIDKSSPDTDTVTAIPFSLALENDSIALPNGFTLKIHAAAPNAGMGIRATLLSDYENFASQSTMPGAPKMTEAQFRQVSNTIANLKNPNVVAIQEDGSAMFSTEGLSMQGFAPRMDGVIIAQPQTFKQDEANMAAAIVEVFAPNGESLGTWLLSAGIGPEFPAQGFDYEGKRYDLSLRFERTYFPFTLQLTDFKHDKYPGTEIPKNFSSDVIIDNPQTGENRPVLIYMNHPLRYEGFTFFQASFMNEDTTSILQVVRNPSWLLPYAAVALVGVGMCIQFSLSLSKRFSELKMARRIGMGVIVLALLGLVKLVMRTGLGSNEWLASVMVLCLLGLLFFVIKTRKPGEMGWPAVIAFILGAIVLFGFSDFAKPSKSEFSTQSFAEIPVQSGGRILPLDSVARNTLKIIRGRQNVRLEDKKLSASEWLLDLAFKPQEADAYPVFRIDHPEVLGLFGWEQTNKKYFSWNELSPYFETLMQVTRQIPEEDSQRNQFQKAVVKLTSSLTLYNALGHSLDPGQDLQAWAEIAKPGSQAMMARERGEPFNADLMEPFVVMAEYFMRLSTTADLGIAPPQPGEVGNDWNNIGEAILETIQTGELNGVIDGYGQMGNAYRQGDPESFLQAVSSVKSQLANQVDARRVAFEELFNQMQPFYTTLIIYVLVLLIVCLSWLKWPAPLQNMAFWLLLLAFLAHTFGLFARMYIQGRPPVTTLYSSAIFVGWVAIILGLILERIYRNGVGAFVASLIGFCTLVIAQNLALTGDTMEMMRAVLDSNFWLATHVIIITAGYGAVFLAGALGLVYILLGMFTNILDKKTARALYGMSYGITCFGLLFSFVGTMLGGIWADQSWGRFWGWDPKENGALIIVLWGALMLHARWGGLVKERGFMILAVGGNIVTAWSWFGTNLLGIGLHSYGFLSAAFTWLSIFWVSQLFIIGVGLTPQRLWGSFKEQKTHTELPEA